MNYGKMVLQENKCNNADLLECVDKEINFSALLNKYGPEGLYIIADKLKELADEEMQNALE
jgi:hypothetical protein